MLKKDNWILGIIIGVVNPAVILGLLYIIFYLTESRQQKYMLLSPEHTPLISIFFNLIIFRYYMVNLKYDKTGRGILLATMIIAIFFFINI